MPSACFVDASSPPPRSRGLKEVFQPELHFSIVIDGRGNFSECGAAQRSRWRAELRRVREIERLPPDLRPVPFLDSEFFEKGEIPCLRGGRVEEIQTSRAVPQRSDENALSRAAVALRADERVGVEP